MYPLSHQRIKKIKSRRISLLKIFITASISIIFLLNSIESRAQTGDKADAAEKKQVENGKNADEQPKNENEKNKGEEKPGFFSGIIATDDLKERKKDRCKITAGGFFEKKIGNTNTFSTNGLVSINYNDGITEILTSYKRFYGEFNRKQNENNGEGIIRLDRFVSSRIELFVFSEFYDDLRQKIKLRTNTGFGAKLVLIRNRYLQTDASAAPLYQFEQFIRYKYKSTDFSKMQNLTIYDIADYYKKHREGFPKSQWRASYRGRIIITPWEDLIEMKASFFYIPIFDNYTRYRTQIESHFRLRLFRDQCDRWGFFILAGFLRKYNNQVQPGAKRIDDKIYGRLDFEKKFL